jgi:hypothetical protein
MTHPIDKGRPRQNGWMIAASWAASLMLGAATFYAVQKLSRDDCTTVTTTTATGSQVTTKTCS